MSEEKTRTITWSKDGERFKRVVVETGKVKDFQNDKEVGDFTTTTEWRLDPLQAHEYNKVLMKQKGDMQEKIAELDRAFDQVKDKTVDSLKDSLDDLGVYFKKHEKNLKAVQLRPHLNEIASLKKVVMARFENRKNREYIQGQMDLLVEDLGLLLPLLTGNAEKEFVDCFE